MEASKKRPRRLCGHCDNELSHTQYFEHKKHYFINGVWNRKSKRVRSDVQNSLRTVSDGQNKSSIKDLKDDVDENTGKPEFAWELEASEEMQLPTDTPADDATTDEQSFHLLLESSDSDSAPEEEAEISCFVDELVTEEDEERQSLAEEQNDHFYEQEQKGHGSDQSSEKTDDMLMRLLAMIILSWQTTFKISDNAITSLLLCIKQFLWIVGTVLLTDSFTAFGSKIPKTLFSLRKWTGILQDNFVQYVVCPKCSTVYQLNETYELRRDGRKECKTCSYIPFYKHPQKRSALKVEI